MSQPTRRHRWRRAAPLATLAALAACKQDQGFAEISIENTVIVTGDFDRLEDPLLRADVKNQVFEGYIVQPVYELSETSGESVQQVEALFDGRDEDGQPLLYTYDALFVNSGARGFGAYVYNAVDADDSLVADPAVIDQVSTFVERNRTVVVTDWAYDLVEAAWPDKIQFLQEDDGLDGAQLGVSETVIARVTDPDLAGALGADQVELQTPWGYWTVMEDVADGVTVHMRGDVDWRQTDGGGSARIEDVPLVVSFEHEGGRVVYSSFAWRAQRQEVADGLLAALVEGLNVSVTGRSSDGAEGGSSE
jgi:hypothetical protein